MNVNREKCIQICNQLLRGEMSAVETYEQALEKFEQEPESRVLGNVCQNHRENAALLRENVLGMGGTPSGSSGAWGTFAKLVEGGARLLGEQATIKALKEGEEHGRKEYDEALQNENVLPECKAMIRGKLLPRQMQHISTLEAMGY